MRTNIDIDDDLMEGAMRAGHFKTKKDAVEAGLKLLSRQAAYHEILKWEGKLEWDGHSDGGIDGRSHDARALSGAVLRTSDAATAHVARESTAKQKTGKAAAKKAAHGRR